MPPVIIAAGVAAAGAVAGSAISGRATTRAVNAQTAAADRQIANSNANRDYQYALNSPTINQGQRAGDLIAGFTGVGGDAAASADALQTFRNSTGYTDLQREGTRSTNAAVFAGGLGQSGAALKALQDRGTQIANSSSQQWLGNVGNIAQRGDQARSLVAGIGTNTVISNNNATQNAADAQSNGLLARAGNTNNLIQNLLNAGSFAYGSSYKPKTLISQSKVSVPQSKIPVSAGLSSTRGSFF
jgi:hypothetical protein